MGRELPGGEFFRRNFTLGYLLELLYRILLMSWFLIADSILCMERLRVIILCKFSPGLNCIEKKSLRKRDFSLEEKPDFLVLFKKRLEIRFKKTRFFN